jgi:hypothetical protein
MYGGRMKIVGFSRVRSKEQMAESVAKRNAELRKKIKETKKKLEILPQSFILTRERLERQIRTWEGILNGEMKFGK